MSNIVCLVLITSSIIGGCYGVEIQDLVVPDVIQNGSRSSVILDCIYRYDRIEKDNLVINWFWNNEPEAVYQWIPGKNPEALGVLKGRLNLGYIASKDKKSRHRALEILHPTTELTGLYRCRVTSFHDESFQSKRMIVYAPATSMNISYNKPNASTVSVTCDAHGIFPKPKLMLYEGTSESSRTLVAEATQEFHESDDSYSVYLHATLQDKTLKQQETIFECVLSIPQTEYQIRRELIYFPGYDQNLFNGVGGAIKTTCDTLTAIFFVLVWMYLH